MPFVRLCKKLLLGGVALAALFAGRFSLSAQSKPQAAAGAARQACPNDDTGLKLPAGFFLRMGSGMPATWWLGRTAWCM
jgi:hypothetical protein